MLFACLLVWRTDLSNLGRCALFRRVRTDGREARGLLVRRNLGSIDAGRVHLIHGVAQELLHLLGGSVTSLAVEALDVLLTLGPFDSVDFFEVLRGVHDVGRKEDEHVRLP